MYQYKYINKSPETQKNLKAITELGKDNWLYQNELDGILIFYKKVTIISKSNKKEVIEEKLYFNESFVAGCCSYYKDIEELYSDWRKQRQSTGKFQVFNERSEKVTWNKISKFPKAIVEEMLKNAIQGSWGRLIDLTSAETEKIMQPIREEKKKQEKKMEGFISEEDKQKAEREKQKIDYAIKTNPNFMKQAQDYINIHNPNVTIGRELMIKARASMIAREYLISKGEI